MENENTKADALRVKAEIKAIDLKEQAVKVAEDLVAHAKEVARQMLLGMELDLEKIPLICKKIVTLQEDSQENSKNIVKIQTDISWLRWLSVGIAGGIGLIVVSIIIAAVNKII